MSDEMTVRTNNVPRDIIDSWELTDEERKEFDYLPWDKIVLAEESASFFRYRGTLYDLGEFMTTHGMPDFNPLTGWDGYMSDSFFSGIVVRYVNDCDQIIVGSFYA